MLKNIIKKRSEFTNNVLTLMTGTTIAQAIPVAIAPVLTRLYTPDDFGIFGIYIAVISIISVIASGRYELAVMLPKKNEEAVHILALSVFIAFIVSILCLIVLFIFEPAILGLIARSYTDADVGSLRLWLYMVPISVLFIALFQAFNYWSTRQKTFRYNAMARISHSTVYASGAVGLGFATHGSMGLIIGNVLGYLTAFTALFIKSFKSVSSKWQTVNLRNLKKVAAKHKLFPLYNAPQALLGSGQAQGIVFVISYFFQLSIVGFFSFTNRIMHIPVTVIGASMHQVFYQKASQIHNEGGSLRPLLVNMYKKTAMIALPIFTIAVLAGPFLFGFIFGEAWHFSGVIAQILAPWLFFNFIANPVASLPLILNRQKKAVAITAVDFVLRLSALVAGGLAGSIVLALALMSFSCSIVLIYILIWYYRISDNKG